MLTDLSWLAKGQQFPPQCEVERLERYKENKRIFNNNHLEVYKQQWKRIERVIGSRAEVISYPIVLNYQKKISLKIADFLFVEPPVYDSTKGEDETETNNDKQREIIESITDNSNLNNIGYQGAIDMSRFGDSVFKVDIIDGKGSISITSPEYLFIIVDPDNRKIVRNYVLAWQYEKTNSRGNKQKYVDAFIHSKGSYIKKTFELTNGMLSGAIEETEEKTGLNDFAVIPVQNIVTSDSIYGIDDYMDVDSIISEIEIRTAQISKILDIHANPSLTGPQAALTFNKRTGEREFKPGDYYQRNSMEEPPIEYLVWEASLESNFKQIDNLLKFLSDISEMGATIFAGDMKPGNIPSGSAMKRLYISALAKVTRFRNSMDAGFKKAIALASQVGYEMTLKKEDISITWQDGLPTDEVENADIISKRTQGQSMSVERAIQQYDGLKQKAAQEEVQTISDEQAAAQGMTFERKATEE